MSIPPRYKLETLHEAQSDLGFVATMGSFDGHIFASGGMSGRATWLYSSDGRNFVRRNYGSGMGLRGHFIDALDRVYTTGEWGKLTLTKNQGETWEELETDARTCFYRIVRAGSTLLMCSDHGLHASTDAGRSWERVYESNGRLLDLYVDGLKVYAVGAGREVVVFEEGQCTTLPLPSWDTLTAIIRSPGGALLVSGDGGQLLRSADEGQSWEVIEHHAKVDIEDIAVVQGRVLAVGGRGTLLHSGDDGRSFHALKTNTNTTLWSLGPVAGGAFIGCDQGEIKFLSLEVEVEGKQTSGESKEPKKR